LIMGMVWGLQLAGQASRREAVAKVSPRAVAA
ncbi:MAG: hypothetical protein QOG74_3376, partial [Alphaproteobacteria bacterium]|nr:hypothetical protein [Alphaproteobacteria bacterium]